VNAADRKDTAPMGNKSSQHLADGTTGSGKTGPHRIYLAEAIDIPVTADRTAVGATEVLKALRELADVRDERLREMGARRLDRFDGPDIQVVIDDPQTLLDDPRIREAVDELLRYGRMAGIDVDVDTADTP
jgi:hypothetical protein